MIDNAKKNDEKERQNAIDLLMVTCVEKKKYDQVEHILKLDPSTNALDFLAINGFRDRWCEGALRLIKHGLTSKETLDSLIEFCIEKGWVSDFKSLIKIRRTPQTKDEIDAIIKTCVQQGYVHSASSAFELRDTPPSTNEIDSLVKACIKNKAIADAREAASWGASKETIKLLANAWVELCVKEGRTLDIQTAADLRGEPLTTDEINELTKSIKGRN